MSGSLSVDVGIICEDPSYMPKYATDFSAGVDLKAKYSFIIRPGERHLVGTGIRLVIPEGYEGQVRPRSGLASKKGITVINTPGTIDSDYRGEVKVCLVNLSDEAVNILPGDRIAQLVILPIPRINFVVIHEMPNSSRGAGGFGSTGT